MKAAAVVAASTAIRPGAIAQSITDGKFQPLFKLAPLPYPFDALEPHIDSRTMEIHHEKHHAAYVANLNAAIAQVPDFYFALKQKGANEQTVEEILKDLGSVPEPIRLPVRNNGGGHYNHTLFWQMMKKSGGGAPKGRLRDAIEKQFGSFGAFKDEFAKAALAQFGSGWAWLTLKAGVLKVESGANQDNPVSFGSEILLGLDVWEHAYYLKYQNRRADYIAAWFNVVNWDFVSERYEKLKV